MIDAINNDLAKTFDRNLNVKNIYDAINELTTNYENVNEIRYFIRKLFSLVSIYYIILYIIIRNN